MQVTSEKAAFITDYEVFQLLKDKERNAESKKKARLKPVEQMVRTLQYLNGTPAAKHNRASITECLSLLERYPLTEVEKLQVLNLQPTSEVEVHLMIEECPERLERESVLELAQQMSAIHAKNKEAEAQRAPPPPPQGVSLAVKGGVPAAPAASAPATEAQASAPSTPVKERAAPERKDKEDVAMGDTPKSKSRQMEELIKTAGSAPRSTRSGNVLK